MAVVLGGKWRELEEQNGAMAMEIEQQKAIIADLHKELSRQEADWKAAQRQVDDLRTKLRSVEGRARDAEGALARSSNELLAAQAALQSAFADAACTGSEFSELRGRFAEEQRAAEAARATSRALADKLATAMHTLEEERAEKKTTQLAHADVQRDVKILAKAKGQKELQIAQLAAEKDRLFKELTQARSELAGRKAREHLIVAKARGRTDDGLAGKPVPEQPPEIPETAKTPPKPSRKTSAVECAAEKATPSPKKKPLGPRPQAEERFLFQVEAEKTAWHLRRTLEKERSQHQAAVDLLRKHGIALPRKLAGTSSTQEQE